MYDKTLLKEKLIQILEAMLKIQRRFSQIKTPADFLLDDRGEDMLDSIAMMLIVVGDNFKKIDKETGEEPTRSISANRLARSKGHPRHPCPSLFQH